MKSVLWYFVTALAVAASYNFADTEFNHLLDEELIAIPTISEAAKRSKRESDPDVEITEPTTAPEPDDAHEPIGCTHNCRKDRPRRRHFRSHSYHGCCGNGSFRKARFMRSKADYSNERECRKEVMEKFSNTTSGNMNSFNYYSCEEVNMRKKKHICMAECLAKKMGIITEDGSYDTSKAKELLVDKLEEEWQKELLDKAIVACGDMKVDVSWKDDPEPYKCNPQALQVKHCIWKQLEMNCPEEHKRPGKRCEMMREYLAKSQEQSE